MAGAVLAVGVIGYAGYTYLQLKQAEAEAAANTVAGTWCGYHPQECHAGDKNGYYRISAIDPLAKPVDTGAFYRPIVFNESGENWSISVVPVKNGTPYYKLNSAKCHAYYYDFCYLGRVGYPPDVTWVPNRGYASASPTWSQLSEGAKQEMFNSGELTRALKTAALSSGIGGVLEPGTLGNQSLAGGVTVNPYPTSTAAT